MFVTLHLVDGHKITQERENIIILRPQSKFAPDVEQGKITVNWQNVVYMCAADDDEIRHSRIHGR